MHVEGNYATSVFIPGQQGPCVQCCAVGRAVISTVMGIYRSLQAMSVASPA